MRHKHISCLYLKMCFCADINPFKGTIGINLHNNASEVGIKHPGSVEADIKRDRVFKELHHFYFYQIHV